MVHCLLTTVQTSASFLQFTLFLIVTQGKDYDLMVEEEDQITFVLAENVPGTITEKVIYVFGTHSEVMLTWLREFCIIVHMIRFVTGTTTVRA